MIENPQVFPLPAVHKGRVFGAVIDETGKGVEGAKGIIDKYSTQTDTEGNFVLKDIPIGLTLIGVREMTGVKEGYRITRGRVGILPENYARDPAFQAFETIRLLKGNGRTSLVEGRSIAGVKTFIEAYKYFGGFSFSYCPLQPRPNHAPLKRLSPPEYHLS